MVSRGAFASWPAQVGTAQRLPTNQAPSATKPRAACIGHARARRATGVATQLRAIRYAKGPTRPCTRPSTPHST
eukprot:2911945-Alexandrium_andersonii.AAC.1